MPTVLFVVAGVAITLGQVAAIAIAIAVAVLQGVISRAFIKKQKSQPLGFDDRTLTITGSINPRQYIYGENRVGGTVVFISRSTNNVDVWLVVAIAGQQIQDIRDIYFNDEQTTYGLDGTIATGTHAGDATIFEHLGSSTQTADANLTTAFPNKWTASHTLSGCAYAVVRLIGFVANWGGSVPNLSFDVKGANDITNNLTGVIGYTDNPALCIRHWLMNTTFGLGEPISAIDDASFRCAANVCDELVAFDAAVQTAFELTSTTWTSVVATDVITLAADLGLNTGDAVTLTTTGTLPPPFVSGTLYYWIRISGTTGKLAATQADATNNVPIDITVGGGGTHTMIVNIMVLTPVDQTVTANAGTDVINTPISIFPIQCVRFLISSTATLPAPLVAGTVYFSSVGTATTIKVATNQTNAEGGFFTLDLTTAGTGTITLTIIGVASSFTADATTDIITLNSPQTLPAATPVTLSPTGNLPAPLVTGTYFWIPLSSTTGRVATSQANAFKGIYIDLTTAGSGSRNLETNFNPIIEMQGLVTGDVVQVSAGTTLPSPLVASTDYYWIRKGRNLGFFASTLPNALAGISIPLTSAGSGLLNITRTRQRRYTVNGMFDGDQTREDVLRALLTSCGGFAAPLPKWAIFPATYRPPLLSLNEDHVRSGGVIEVTPRNARRETFNTVTGVYVTPENFDQPASFPQLQDPDALTEDNGDVLVKDITLPFTNNKQMALRLARIELNRARLQNTVAFPANLQAYPVRVGDTVDVSVTALGWSKKIFEVTSWEFKLDNAGGNDKAMLPAIDLKMRETNPSVYR